MRKMNLVCSWIRVALLLVMAMLSVATAQSGSPGGFMAVCAGDARIDPSPNMHGGLSGESWTLEAWAAFPPSAVGGDRSFLFGRDNGGGAFFCIPSTGEIGVFYQSGPLLFSFNANSLTPGWHHVAISHDGTSTLYLIDGVVVEAVAIEPPIAAYIGGGESSFNGWGAFDEVRFWDVARTPQEVQSTKGFALDAAPDLINCWHLDGNAQDSVGQSHGALLGGAFFIPSSAPIFGSIGTTSCSTSACLQANTPFTLGNSAYFTCTSPTSVAPIYILLDIAPGSAPLGPFGVSQLVFSPGLTTIADPSGVIGPSVAMPITDASGGWSAVLPVPNAPGLLGLHLFLEAYVLDFFAPNGFFHQSNLLTVEFQ